MTETLGAQNSKKKVRSTAYPAIVLEEAINSAAELRRQLGSGPYSREAAAQALGYKGVSGASSAKIAAISHFGLLSRTGDTYKQSTLADRILVPTSDEDKNQAITEALKTPKLYSKLIAEYSGKSLPSMLPNILFRIHKINEKVTRDVAATFTASLEYAGVLQNGVIAESSMQITDESKPQDKSVPQSHIPTRPPVGHQTTDINPYSAPLPSGIVVSFPPSLVYDFTLGKFSGSIKSLEETAQEIMKGKNDTGLITSSAETPTSTKKLDDA